MIMKVHYLACTYQGFGCQNGHISSGLILVIIGVVVAIASIGGALKAADKRYRENHSPRGTDLSIFVWAAGDVSDLEQYVYWSSNPGCCIVGSKPMPWAIGLDTSGYAASYAAGVWSSVERALKGAAVTSAPASWQYGSGTLPTPSSNSPSPTPSPTPTPTPTPSHRRHHARVTIPPPPAQSPTPPAPQPPPSSTAWCTASADYNSTYQDYDVYVNSNQPNHSVTASASNGESQSYYTNSSGYADVYLYADPGDSITVQVGAATCSTTAG
jgi:hypothetical protein